MSDPQRLAVLPLRDVVLFPHVVMPLLVGRSASLAAVASAVTDGGLLFLVAQRDPDVQEPAAGDLHRVGVTGRILQAVALPNGTTRVLVEATGRARVTRYGMVSGHLRAVIEPFDPEPGTDDEAAARRALTLFEEYVALQRRIPGEVVAMVQGADSITRQAFGIAAHLAVRLEVRQRLLET
nr:LON peptidase substrate-binding domain-containing protein [Gemmatimonadaceae bacterium]